MSKKTTSITITAARRPRAPAKSRAREVRHGAFTRIEDDPLAPPDAPPVLVVTYFDLSFAAHTKTYSIKTPALPKDPKETANAVFNFIARAKTVGFPKAQGYGFAGNLAAFNLAKPRAPVLTSSVGADFGQLVVEEGVLYMTRDGFITAFDVSDPAAIALIHDYNAMSDFGALQSYMGRPAVLNKRLYVASFPNFGGGSYLATYNFDDPAAATQIDVITLQDFTIFTGTQNQKPPVALGVGVIYLSFQFMDTVLGDTYTTKLKTYSLASPDAPAEVNSINVVASGSVSGDAPAHAYDRLWLNKSKTRLFLLTLGHSSLTGTLRMYDITTPAAPALLDSIAYVYDQPFAQSAMYATDSGLVYLGTFAPTPSIEVYDVTGGTFALQNTVAIPAESQAYVVYALDKKGFPQ